MTNQGNSTSGFAKSTSCRIEAERQSVSMPYSPMSISGRHVQETVGTINSKMKIQKSGDQLDAAVSTQTSRWTSDGGDRTLRQNQTKRPAKCPPEEHCSTNQDACDSSQIFTATSLQEEYRQRLAAAQTLRGEIARLKQANLQIKAEIDKLTHEKQTLLVQVETQENKNNQLSAENTEYMIRVAENKFLEEHIAQMKRQLNEVNEQANESRKVRRQLRADCVRVELERQRLLDEYFRLESSQTVNREQLEALRKRRAQLECYQEDLVQRQQWTSRMNEMTGAIRVFVRIRSVQSSAKTGRKSESKASNKIFESGCLSVSTEEKISLYLNNDCPTNDGVKQYQFNRIFPPDASQKAVYQTISEQIKRVMEGFNVTILFHGTYGGGKTYTCCGTRDQPGVASRACDELLKLIRDKGLENWALNVSMIEIHNEHVTCLLSKKPVKIKDTGTAVHVENQKEVRIHNVKDFNTLLSLAAAQRKSISINRSHTSSRSHLFILIKLISQLPPSGIEITHVGTLILGDLSGLYRVGPPDTVPSLDRQFKQESWYLQKSLIFFASLFHNLKRSEMNVHCRGTRLTELLKPCFCGDSYLTLVLNVTDEPEMSATTHTVLEVGRSAQTIMLGAPINHLII